MESFQSKTMKNLAKILVYRFGDRLVWKVAETIKSKI